MSTFGFPLGKEETAFFLQVLDPFNHQRITFSECVQLFSSHMVNEDNFDSSEVDINGDGGQMQIPMLEKLNKIVAG